MPGIEAFVLRGGFSKISEGYGSVRRADIPLMNRGGAAAFHVAIPSLMNRGFHVAIPSLMNRGAPRPSTWLFRGDESRRRRGYDVVARLRYLRPNCADPPRRLRMGGVKKNKPPRVGFHRWYLAPRGIFPLTTTPPTWMFLW